MASSRTIPTGPLCTIASLHLDACVPNFMIQEGGIHPWFQDACTGDFSVQKDGFLAAAHREPDSAVGMDEDWLKANPWRDDAAVWRPGGRRYSLLCSRRTGHKESVGRQCLSRSVVKPVMSVLPLADIICR